VISTASTAEAVVDASVAVKWVLRDEADSERADVLCGVCCLPRSGHCG
jgi:hypothetical protein